jgi:hypothetical protein
MAKRQIRQYVFSPGSAGVGFVRVPGRVNLDQVLLITNTSKNIIIYNFADPAFTGSTAVFTAANDATNFPTVTQREDGYTTITLASNTSAQSASDKIQVLVEDSEYGMRIRPWAFGTDAIERMRVSNPKSMIDADFEYGLWIDAWLSFSI